LIQQGGIREDPLRHFFPVDGSVRRKHLFSQKLHQPFIAGLAGELHLISHLVRQQDAAAAVLLKQLQHQGLSRAHSAGDSDQFHLIWLHTSPFPYADPFPASPKGWRPPSFPPSGSQPPSAPLRAPSPPEARHGSEGSAWISVFPNPDVSRRGS